MTAYRRQALVERLLVVLIMLEIQALDMFH